MSPGPTILPRTRTTFALLLWAAVAAVVWFTIQGDLQPTATDATLETAERFLGRMLLGAVVVLALAVLVWPPFIPAVRVGWRRTRERMRVDQRPMHEALARLAHFDNAADHLTVGRTLFRMGAAPRALPHLAKALELDRDSAAAHFLAAQALLQVGQVSLALEQFKATLTLDPEHGFGDALLSYGTALQRVGDEDSAEAILAQHEARFGPARRADVLRAKIALSRGDRDAAARFAARAARPLEKTPVTNLEEVLARAQARVLAMRLGAPK